MRRCENQHVKEETGADSTREEEEERKRGNGESKALRVPPLYSLERCTDHLFPPSSAPFLPSVSPTSWKFHHESKVQNAYSPDGPMGEHRETEDLENVRKYDSDGPEISRRLVLPDDVSHELTWAPR